MIKDDRKETIDSLSDLVEKLESMEANEEKQSTELLTNQREIKALSPLKVVIESNLSKFESDWPAMATSLQRIRQSLDTELEELRKELEAAAIAKIDGAIRELSTKNCQQQELAKSLDESLNGTVSWKRIDAEDSESLAKSRFSEIPVTNMAKRIANAEARLKKAGSVATNNDAFRAEKYVLLRQVSEDLDKSRIETDYLTHSSDFVFPKDRADYEKLLVLASLNYTKVQESLFHMRAAEDTAVTDLKQNKIAILASGQNRVDRIIAKARESIAGCDK